MIHARREARSAPRAQPAAQLWNPWTAVRRVRYALALRDCPVHFFSRVRVGTSNGQSRSGESAALSRA